MSAGPDPALGPALRYLAASEKSEAELRSFLAKKGVEEAELERIVAYCKSKKFVMDERLADREAELAKSQRFDGRLKVAAKLERRGVDEAVLDRAMTAYSEADESEAAKAWLRTKRFSDPRKAARSLTSKGFGEEATRAALAEAFPDTEF
ncbi:MAG: RecX family transcriptional regulator [Armatimonadetes bacterium]|nr:RecX family transcriptional regulator [Armatimonadota bacterium]